MFIKRCPICLAKITCKTEQSKTCWNRSCVWKRTHLVRKLSSKKAICKRCWKEYIKSSTRRYCDECYYERICPICWDKIYWWRYETCSKECSVILTQQLHWEMYKEYAKVMHTKESKEKAYAWRKWRPNPKNRWPKYNRRWENHPLRRWWKTLWTRRWIQYSPEYKSLIKEIYTRDDYTCQICLVRWWTTLNVHHIRTRDYYPELRMDKNNLVTLCEKCHKKVHKLWWWTHWVAETFSILFKLTHEL